MGAMFSDMSIALYSNNETLFYVCGGCWKRNEEVPDNINVLFEFGVHKKYI
jgi:hypothetical protein